MPNARVESELSRRLGLSITHAERLHGGCVAEVYRVQTQDGRALAIKIDRRERPALDIEAWMLEYLATHSSLPVPGVILSSSDLLAMDFLPGESRFSRDAERHAAELLAALHGIRSDRHGLERDTLIGSLHQPNMPSDSWIDFFRECRLLDFARLAHAEHRITAGLLARIEGFAKRLHDFLEEPVQPSLLHGDAWSGNVLADRGHITGFLDPAIYFGDPEIELAFITLFDTFGPDFFARYRELRSIRPGFFETRRHVYNLYPLLVHVRLFGGAYVAQVEQTLRRLGY